MYENEVNVGDVLRLNLELPTNRLISASGRVIWIGEVEIVGDSKKKRYDVGIELVDISEDDRNEIKKFIFAYRRWDV